MTTQAWIPYCGAAPDPVELIGRWNLDPTLLAALAVGLLAGGRGLRNAPARHKNRFFCAYALLLLLFVSPFCALTSALFSARVVHHVLLGAAVAPLLIGSLPRALTAQSGRLATATAIQAAVFWLWHAPPVYGWALSADAAYWLMQISLLASACLFWVGIRSASAPAAAAALLATMVHMGLLGALITFAPNPLYAPHLTTTLTWGLTPLDDQQLAGLIMWAPAAGLYLGAALLLIGRWLGSDDLREPSAA